MVLVALAAVLAGCAEESPVAASPVTTTEARDAATTVATTTTASTTAAAPTTTTAPGFPVTVEGTVIPAPPRRIAALSATHVEMLFAIGAGDRVIAVDAFSNYPPGVEELVQVDAFNLNVEAVVALDADLVVLAYDPGGAVEALRLVGVPTLLLGPAGDLEDAYRQIEVLGTATGLEAAAADLVAAMSADIGEAVAAAGDRGAGATYYHETDPFSYYTPNSDTFIGRVYSLFGMENVADAAGDEFGSGYPQLAPEFIIAADPDWIFLTFGETSESVAARPGWNTLSALGAGRVVTLDSDVASRWGPRVVDFVQAVAGALAGE